MMSPFRARLMGIFPQPPLPGKALRWMPGQRAKGSSCDLSDGCAGAGLCTTWQAGRCAELSKLGLVNSVRFMAVHFLSRSAALQGWDKRFSYAVLG